MKKESEGVLMYPSTEMSMSFTEQYAILMLVITLSIEESEINELVDLIITVTGLIIESEISNYKSFFKLLIWLIIQNSAFIITVVANFIFNPSWSEQIRIVYGFEEKIIFYVFHSLLIFSNAVELFVASKLLFFHLYLKVKGISTFEYIKRKDKNYKSRFVVKKEDYIKAKSASSKDDSSV